MDPRRFTTFVLVFGAIGLTAVAIEWLRMRVNGWLALIIVSLVLLVSALIVQNARAHDHNQPGLNDWLKSLHSSNGTWCCNGDDVTYLDGSDWETTATGYRVRHEGQWFTVPDSALIKQPNKRGPALAWFSKGYSGTAVRCFLPGLLT